MTLILTAICKDGICVCADTRYVDQKWNKGLKDGFNKIHKFESYPLIIFNHGVNKFNNKYWDEFCSEYEQSGQWLGKGLIQIADDFKNFIKDDVESELKKGKAQSNVSGFVLCGKTPEDSKYKIKEFYWSLVNNEPHCQPKRHRRGLVRTGIGAEYIKDYINTSEGGKLNTISFWKKMGLSQAKKELERLFKLAVAKKNKIVVTEENKLKGDEFSDNSDIDCI